MALREAAWLTGARARAWCRVLALLTVLMAIAYLATVRHGLDLRGEPLGTDFVSFYTAARLAWAGHAAWAYDPTRHYAAQRTLFPAMPREYFAFFYPPGFLLLCLPLAAQPYFGALAAWIGAGFAALALSLRRLLPARWAILPICALPALVVNAGQGQTGLLTAGCLGWAMALGARRPFCAGMCLGLLVIKPHLLLAAPVALLAARRWRALAGAATSAVLVCGLSWWLLGDAAWQGFFHASALARATLQQGLVEPWKMQSVFAAARLLHGGVGAAYLLQGAAAIGACALLARACARRPGITAEWAMLGPASLLCTPFLLDYDLAGLTPAIAWVASRPAWRPWTRTVLLAAYILPIAARPWAMATGLPIAPAVVAGLLIIAWREARAP